MISTFYPTTIHRYLQVLADTCSYWLHLLQLTMQPLRLKVQQIFVYL